MPTGRPPPVPPDADLKDFPFTPMYRARLFGSAFNARANDSEWRAGVTLWLKSQDQFPAGSLPNDEIELCRLAELGRDLKAWRRIRGMALHGWYECDDGRLYHAVVAEVVNEQWTAKLRRAWATHCARMKKAAQRRGTEVELPSFEEWLSQRHLPNVPRDNDATSPGTSVECPQDTEPLSPGTNADVPREIASKGQHAPDKGQGQGQGQGESPPTPPPSPTDVHSTGAAEHERTAGSRTMRGTRLAADWQPCAELRTFAEHCGLNPDEAAAEFRDYWAGVPGAKGRKLDWDATFRNRCRDRAGRRPGNGLARSGGSRPSTGSIIAALGSFRLPGEVD